MKRQAWKRMQAWLLVVAMLVSVVTGIGTTKTAKAATKMGVTYTVHVQTYGDQQGWVHDGTMAGTKGQAKRLEEIRVKLTGDEYSGSIQYKTHIQSYGWQDWSYNGEKSGSRGQAKRLEGIEIQLTGEVAKHYDVVYRVHCQTYGWMDWVKNGVMAGTSGQAKRLEGIEIKLVPKSQIVDMGVQYRVHCQTHGWMSWLTDGKTSGTTGEGKRLEAIEVKLTGNLCGKSCVFSIGRLRWCPKSSRTFGASLLPQASIPCISTGSPLRSGFRWRSASRGLFRGLRYRKTWRQLPCPPLLFPLRPSFGTSTPRCRMTQSALSFPLAESWGRRPVPV